MDQQTTKERSNVQINDFFLLLAISIVIFVLCCIGAMLIYVAEQPDGSDLLLGTGAKQSNSSDNQVYYTLNLADYFGFSISKPLTINFVNFFFLPEPAVITAAKSSASFERMAIKFLRHVLPHHGVDENTWQVASLNSTHVKVTLIRANNQEPLKFDVYGSFYYSFDVITTVGFGHRIPVTTVGKILTTFLTMLGCPVIILFSRVLAVKMKRYCSSLSTFVIHLEFLCFFSKGLGNALKLACWVMEVTGNFKVAPKSKLVV